MLATAHRLARKGQPVFPCRTDKQPATPHGFKDATTDEATVERWFAEPGRLLAVPTRGWLVVDVDVPKPGSNVDRETPWETWHSLCESAGFTCDMAPVAATPSGGRHIWFRQPAGAHLRNTAGKLGPCIDTRGDGGYVIVPPSTLEDGRRYEWCHQLCVPPVAPVWLVERLMASIDTPSAYGTTPGRTPDDRYARAALESELGRLAVAPEGQRNHQLNVSAFALGQLVSAGRLDVGDVAYRLHTVAARIGLSDREATVTIQSGLNAGLRSPRVAA